MVGKDSEACFELLVTFFGDEDTIKQEDRRCCIWSCGNQQGGAGYVIIDSRFRFEVTMLHES